MDIVEHQDRLVFRQGKPIFGIWPVVVSCTVYFLQLYFGFSHFFERSRPISHWLSFLFIELLFLFIVSRTVYFAWIDRDAIIERQDQTVTINGRVFHNGDAIRIFVSRYGNKVRGDTCNVYVEIGRTKIPVAINLREKDLQMVIQALTRFFKTNDVKQTRYPINI